MADYWDGRPKLTYAVPDAKSLASAFRDAGNFVDERQLGPVSVRPLGSLR